MNVFVVLLAFAWPGEAAVISPPVLLAQAGAMHDQAHDAFEDDHYNDDLPPRRESYLVWSYNALGIYWVLLLLAVPLVIFGSIIALVIALSNRRRT